MEQEFNLFDYYTLTSHKNILISYKGPVTDALMSEIVKDIRYKLSKNPKAGKKLFGIFIELSQNILYYSAEVVRFGEKADRVGTILITEEAEAYRLACGNLVESTYIDELIESCQTINEMKKDELRDYKREQRSLPQGVRSKGAGIGLIQAALTSGNPLQIDSMAVDEQFTFFSLSVTIEK